MHSDLRQKNEQTNTLRIDRSEVSGSPNVKVDATIQ